MFYIGNNTVDLRIESINPLRIEIEILDLVRAFAVLATPALRFGEFLFLEISEFLSYSQGLSGAKDNFRFFDQAGGKFLGGRGSRRAYPKTEIAQFAYIHPAPLREISFQHDIDTVEYRLDLGGAYSTSICHFLEESLELYTISLDPLRILFLGCFCLVVTQVLSLDQSVLYCHNF